MGCPAIRIQHHSHHLNLQMTPVKQQQQPLIARNTAELEFGLTLVSSNWPLHLFQGQTSAFKGSSIDHGLRADTKEASAVLLEDSCPQAILKHRPPNSLNYMVGYDTPAISHLLAPPL